MNLAGQKTGCPQEGPKVPGVVVPLMVVHLVGWAQPKSERGKLEKALSTPRRNVEKEETARREHASTLGEHVLRLPEMLKYRQAQDEVKVGIGKLCERRWQLTLDHARVRETLGLLRDRDIDEG